MRRNLAISMLVIALQANVLAADQLVEGLVNIKFQSDARLFAVLAAANAAGLDIDAVDLQQNPVRKLVRDRLANLDPELRKRLQTFFQALGPIGDSNRQGRFVSYALLLTGPPAFNLAVMPGEMPEDTRQLAGFEAVLRDLWQQAELNRLWDEVRPQYLQEIEIYRPLLRSMIVQVLGYFRSEPRVALDRQVIFIPDLLNGFGIVNARNMGDNYVVIVGPSRTKDKPMRGLRHEYLHFLLDPMVNKYRGFLPEPEPFLKRIREQPGVREEYERDFSLVTAESLIQAVELRLEAKPREQLEMALLNAFEQGLILVPYFEEAMEKFEAGQESIQELFPGLIENIRWDVESKRSTAIAQIRTRAQDKPATPRLGEKAQPAPKSELRGLLVRANQLLQERDFDGAKSDLEKALQLEPGNANALFGMAQTALHERALERALVFYEQAAANAGSEVWIAGWSLVHRGNIYAMMGDPTRARDEWARVLRIQGNLRGAAEAAQKALAAEKKPDANAFVPGSQRNGNFFQLLRPPDCIRSG